MDTSGDVSETRGRWLTADEQRAWRAVVWLQGPLMAELGRRLVRDSGLSFAEYEVLVALSEAPGGQLSVRQLLDAIDWEASRLSHQLTRMQARGLVVRRASALDARRSEVTLTDRGEAAIRAAAPAHVRAVRDLLIARLDPAQLQALAELATLVGAVPQRAVPEPEE